MNNITRHTELCRKLEDIYAKKNHDYGDSFHDSYAEFGPTAAVVRMMDKMNRIKTLANGHSVDVEDESLIDTLLDLANYSIMFVMELEKKSNDQSPIDSLIEDIFGELDPSHLNYTNVLEKVGLYLKSRGFEVVNSDYQITFGDQSSTIITTISIWYEDSPLQMLEITLSDDRLVSVTTRPDSPR